MDFDRAFDRCVEFPHASELVGEMTPDQVARAGAAGLIVKGQWLEGADWALPLAPRPRKYHWGALNAGGMGHSAS